MYKTLCISGGGVSGISAISALKCLKNNKIFDNKKIKKYVGTSAGSIICFFLSMDYEPEYLFDFFKTFNFNYLFDNVDIQNLFNDYGFNKGQEFLNMIKSFLYNKLHVNDITFKELYKLTKKKIGIIGTNLSKNREEYFSLETTPDMSILIAIKISISIPIILSPVFYNESYYADGGIVNNFPINYCNKKNTLGIILHNTKNINIINFSSYTLSLYHNLFKFLNYKNKIDKNNTIILNGIVGYSPNSEEIIKCLNKSYNETNNFICQNNKLLIYSLVNDLIDSFFVQLKI